MRLNPEAQNKQKKKSLNGDSTIVGLPLTQATSPFSSYMESSLKKTGLNTG